MSGRRRLDCNSCYDGDRRNQSASREYRCCADAKAVGCTAATSPVRSPRACLRGSVGAKGAWPQMMPRLRVLFAVPRASTFWLSHPRRNTVNHGSGCRSQGAARGRRRSAFPIAGREAPRDAISQKAGSPGVRCPGRDLSQTNHSLRVNRPKICPAQLCALDRSACAAPLEFTGVFEGLWQRRGAARTVLRLTPAQFPGLKGRYASRPASGAFTASEAFGWRSS